MKKVIILLGCIATFIACNSIAKQKTEQTLTIDSILQTQVDSILQNKLSEINATLGQVIVMEVQTGEVKASVGPSILRESGLVRTASLLAALETKTVKLSDTIDVDDGILTIGKDTLRDHNWHRGGYGKFTVEQGFGLASNIANYKMARKAFESEQAFAEALGKYGYQVKDTSLIYNPLGYGILTTPLQNLTFYNAIAKGEIASNAATNSIKQALEYTVTDGLAKPALSDKVKVAGATGTVQLSNNEYAVEFCGYFPADNPKYSVIVSINKKGLPASGGLMAGDVFRQIANILTTEESPYTVSLESLTADTILKTNRKLVLLMDSLYRYVHRDSFLSSILVNDVKWMNKYRNQLCNYYSTNKLGTDAISLYAKADTVIEASRRLWELDSDESTAGMVISNNVERTRLIFQQYNEYAHLLELCKTEEQRGLLKNEFSAWLDLEDLTTKIYRDCVYLNYWGGSIIGPISSAGILRILESHISLYRKDRDILRNDFHSCENNGVFLESGKDSLLNCCQLALTEYVYEDEKSEEYKELITTVKHSISMLPKAIDNWISARELWTDKVCTDGFRRIYRRNSSEVLIKLSNIISSVQ